MREIKFRAWFKSDDDGAMLTHEDLINMDQETHAMYTIITNEEQDEDVVFMQYAGLKDKNGVEIYEGDICRVSDEEPYSNELFYADYDWSLIGEVSMIDCALFVHSNDGLSIPLYNIRSGSIEVEVVGNVYQNPELLEVQHD